VISNGHGTPRGMLNQTNSQSKIENLNNPRDSDYAKARNNNERDEIRDLMNEMNNQDVKSSYGSGYEAPKMSV